MALSDRFLLLFVALLVVQMGLLVLYYSMLASSDKHHRSQSASQPPKVEGLSPQQKPDVSFVSWLFTWFTSSQENHSKKSGGKAEVPSDYLYDPITDANHHRLFQNAPYAFVSWVDDLSQLDAAMTLAFSLRQQSGTTCFDVKDVRCVTILFHSMDLHNVEADPTTTSDDDRDNNGALMVDLRPRLYRSGWMKLMKFNNSSSATGETEPSSFSLIPLLTTLKFQTRVLYLHPTTLILQDLSYMFFSSNNAAVSSFDSEKNLLVVHGVSQWHFLQKRINKRELHRQNPHFIKKIQKKYEQKVIVAMITQVQQLAEIQIEGGQNDEEVRVSLKHDALLERVVIDTAVFDVQTQQADNEMDGKRRVKNENDERNDDEKEQLGVVFSNFSPIDYEQWYGSAQINNGMEQDQKRLLEEQEGGNVGGLASRIHVMFYSDFVSNALKPALSPKFRPESTSSSSKDSVGEFSIPFRIWWAHYESIAATKPFPLLSVDDGSNRSLVALFHAPLFWIDRHLSKRNSKLPVISNFLKNQMLWIQIGTRLETPLISGQQTIRQVKNWTVPGMQLVAGREGQSCFEACSETLNTKGCLEEGLNWWVPNSCFALRNFFGETDSEFCRVCHDNGELTTSVSPAMDVTTGVCTAGYYVHKLYGETSTLSTCAASSKQYSRMCVCFSDANERAGKKVSLHPERITEEQLWFYFPRLHQKEQKIAETSVSPVDAKIVDSEEREPPPTTAQDASKNRKKRSLETLSDSCPCSPFLIASIGNMDMRDTHPGSKKKSTLTVVKKLDDHRQRCIEYLAEFGNVEKVVAMLSTAKFGRTVKMRLYYKNPCVEAVLKLPQTLFPLEPYAEFVGYEIDQLMGFNYVPPTTWIFVPLAAIENAATQWLNGKQPIVGKNKKKKDAETKPEGGKDTTGETNDSGPDEEFEYSAWVGKEVSLYAMNHDLVVAHPKTGRLVLGGSIQLWIPGARTAFNTPLVYDEKYYSFFEYNSAKELQEVLSSFEIKKTVLKKEQQRRNCFSKVLPYISDTMVYDSIINNDDRGPIKNTNVFKVPGSLTEQLHQSFDDDAQQQEKKVDFSSQYHYLHVDQGKSFYLRAPPKNYPINDEKDLHKFCLFRRSTYSVLKALNKPSPYSLYDRLVDVIPAPILEQIGKEKMIWMQTRLDDLIKRMEACKAALGESLTFVWE